jgi:predicted Zn-dependent protease
MKALNQNFFEKFSEIIFSSLTSDEEMSINLSAEKTMFSRFSKAHLRQITEVNQGYVNLNFIKNNKTMTLYLKYTGDEAVDVLNTLNKIKEARGFLNVMQDDPYLVRPKNLGNSNQDGIHQEISGEEMMEAVAEVSSGLDLAGLLTNGLVVRASVNSKGQKHWFKTQNFALDYSLYNTKQKAVKSMYAGNKFVFNELEKNIVDSKNKLELMNREIKKVPRGEYRIYLAPSAVSELMGILSWGGVSMSAHQRGQGSLNDLWKGKKRLSSKFNLSEDFSINTTPRFNENGEAAEMLMPIIEAGVLKNFLTSTRTSNEFKLNSNNASDWEAMRSPVVKPGNLEESEILKTIGDGLYISDLHYLNWSDRDTARITGMTRYACFWIQNGELVSPIEDLRFDESYYHIFGDGLIELTKESQIIPATGSYFEREVGGMKVPGIVVDQFKFTL